MAEEQSEIEREEETWFEIARPVEPNQMDGLPRGAQILLQRTQVRCMRRCG